MSEEEPVKEEKGKKKRHDHTELEFEYGNIEFEAKGRSIVVERMFRLLLEKIETGKLVATFRLQDDEEEEEEEEEEESDDEEELPETDLSEEISVVEDEAPIITPPPAEFSTDIPPSWDKLETEEPPVSDVEREELDIE